MAFAGLCLGLPTVYRQLRHDHLPPNVSLSWKLARRDNRHLPVHQAALSIHLSTTQRDLTLRVTLPTRGNSETCLLLYASMTLKIQARSLCRRCTEGNKHLRHMCSHYNASALRVNLGPVDSAYTALECSPGVPWSSCFDVLVSRSSHEKISNKSSFGIIDIAESSISDRIIVIVDTACLIHDGAYR